MSQEHTAAHYIKIYVILMVLFAISVIGPELGIRWVTLVTAFGIAVVKALMVAAYFMHLNIERKLITYMLITMLLAMGMFYAGTSPDVLQTSGQNWENKSSLQIIEDHKGAQPTPHHD
jgi:caa(3)-type oxidase subunit IV